MLSYFLLHSKVDQLYIYLLFLDSLSTKDMTEYGAESAVLYARSLSSIL